MKPACVVLITAPRGAPARKIAAAILKSRAAACVNVVPAVSSSYWWKGKMETAHESLLIVKTTLAAFPKLKSVILRTHPYELPEIIALPIRKGHRPYLAWIANEVR